MSPSLYVLGTFQIALGIYVLTGLDLDLPIYTSLVAWMTDMNHHTQLFLLIEMGSHELSAQAGLIK
jgi:hypothetical protein